MENNFLNEESLLEFIQSKIQNDIEIKSDTLLYTVGISSFDLVSLICELEEKFGINVNLEQGMNIETVHDLYNVLICN